MNVIYNDPRPMNNRLEPANANLVFNAGVYMSAIKPALQFITEGWKKQIKNSTVTCTEVSDRLDTSEAHKVCTKLVLVLSSEQQTTKIVLHFYHTDNKIQVQGSSIFQGVSSVVWLVENLLIPLAKNHIDKNSDAINVINADILETASKLCYDCNKPINPKAAQPKDQNLTCYKCEKSFHKKCTDRRSGKSNRQKQPFYCHCCILPPQENNSLASGVQQLPHNVAPDTLACPGTELDVAIIEAIQEIAMEVQENDTPSNTVLDPSAAEFTLQNLPPPNSTTGGNLLNTIFPRNTRQRSSNVNLTDPEKECLKTAPDSCRSSITQQESEIKRLNESLDIRNRRIMLLESQVNIAASHVAASTPDHVPT